MAFQPRPLPVAIALALGLALAGWIGAEVWWLVAGALALAGLRHPPLFLGAALATGLAHGLLAPVTAPPGAIADDRDPDRIAGTIAGPALRTARGAGALLRTDTVAIWIWTEEPLHAGERIAVTGRLVTPRQARGPAQPDREALVRTRGAALELTATRHRAPGDRRVLDRVWVVGEVRPRGPARSTRGRAPIARGAARHRRGGSRRGARRARRGGARSASFTCCRSAGSTSPSSPAWRSRCSRSSRPRVGRPGAARAGGRAPASRSLSRTRGHRRQLATLRALIAIKLVLVAAMPIADRIVDAIGVAAIAILAWRPGDLLVPVPAVVRGGAHARALPRDPTAAACAGTWCAASRRRSG